MAITSTADTPDNRPHWLGWLPAPNPFSVLTFVFLISLLFAPLIHYPFDVESCWLPWSRASLGKAPWLIYQTRSDCNYPPFELYILTIQEAIRNLIGAKEMGATSVCLTKIPNIVAHVVGALAGYLILRRPYGEIFARRFALLYALSLPLFVNAALWGQADALLSLAMVLTVVLLMADKPIPAGAAMGWALSIKLQAVVIVPVLLLYTFRKYGWQVFLKAIGTGFAVLFAFALPFLLTGTGNQVLKAYIDAAHYYPQRTLNTFNLWGYLNYVDEYLRHIPGKIVNQDDRLALGPLTYRHIGILLFGGALLSIMTALWKRLDGKMLALSSALSVLAFTTLCTQMHERYAVPGVALLALFAPESLFALLLYLLFSAVSFWNQWLVLLCNYLQYNRVPDWIMHTGDSWGWSLIYLSIASVILLSAGMGYQWRFAFIPAPEPPTKREQEKQDKASSANLAARKTRPKGKKRRQG